MAFKPCSCGSAGSIEPLAISKEQAFQIIGMPKILQRWLHHRWVEIVRQGGRGCRTIIDYQSLKVAYNRLRAGEEPPLLPSEIKRAVQRVPKPTLVVIS
jgi:hypothetical protein